MRPIVQFNMHTTYISFSSDNNILKLRNITKINTHTYSNSNKAQKRMSRHAFRFLINLKFVL